MHDASYREMKVFADGLSRERRLIVGDIGAFDVNGCYRPIFNCPDWTYIGYDVQPGPNVDIVLPDQYRWDNIPDGFLDVVISGQTLEHVRHPWLWIKEVNRIVKPQGLACIIAPHTIGYHAYPIDCWRIWPDGMKALLEWGGFRVVSCKSSEVDTIGVGQVIR